MKQDTQAILDAIRPMRNSLLRNYIVPGLNSNLIGGAEFGKVRLFSATRAARDFVTPHSHRFDFTALVLRGIVRNTIFSQHLQSQEEWCLSTIGRVCGADGLENYNHIRATEVSLWTQKTTVYVEGETYAMQFAEIHSIQFESDTEVLMFEGPQQTEFSRMLEPWVNGKVVPTFKTEDWMFERGVA